MNPNYADRQKEAREKQYIADQIYAATRSGAREALKALASRRVEAAKLALDRRNYTYARAAIRRAEAFDRAAADYAANPDRTPEPC